MVKKYTQSIINYYSQSNINIEFNKSYWTQINKFYELIKKNYTNKLKININQNINQNIPIIHQIKNKVFSKVTFVSSNIAKTLHKYIYAHRVYYNNIQILYFSYKNTLSKKTIEELKICIYRTNAIKSLSNNHKPVIISIFPTLFKKTINKLSKKFKPLGTKNVNSGLTFYSLADDNNGTIIIWRKEEINKVIIHELFHAIYVDLGLILNEHIFDDYMKINFNLDKFIGVNESYVETIASIFNIIFCTLEQQKSKSIIKNYIEVELFHAITKAAQILNYYNFSSLKDLINDSDKKFNQNSNIFSYYILKTLTLYKFDKIMCILAKSKCIKNHLTLNKSETCSNNYLHIISNLYSNKIDSMIKNIIINRNFINNSLRMTCIE